MVHSFKSMENLVNKRVIVKDLSRLGTVVEDGSRCADPYLAIRLDHAPQFIKKFKLDEVVVIGEVQSNNNSDNNTRCG